MFGINPYAPYGIPPGTMGPATGQMNPQYQNNYISPPERPEKWSGLGNCPYCRRHP